jgi:hypothetical protein
MIPLPPRNRLIIYGVIAAIGLAYLLWLRFKAPDVRPGEVVQAAPAKAVKNEPVVTEKPKQLIVYRDTVRIVEKMGLPPAAPQERVQQAVEVPRLKYGGTAVTFTNLSTGQSRSVIKASESPWFAFRNDLALGVGAGVSTGGNTSAVRLRYDVAQIKALTVSGEVEGNYTATRDNPVEGKAMLWLEYRR